MKTTARLPMPVLSFIFFAILSYCTPNTFAQTKLPAPADNERKDFNLLLKDANLKFDLPTGFKEIKAINNDYFSFDYALEDTEHNCEVWLTARPQKQNWISYEKAKHDKKTELANPDSMYVDVTRAYATELTGGKNFTGRDIPNDVLADYNADGGKSYLLNLRDLPVFHHYKYALIFSIQKDHTGTLIAVFFTNYKDADFYRDVNRVSHSFKFIPEVK